MKIGILHLSDIHISVSSETLLRGLINKLQEACYCELNNILKLYIVVSGDIANTASREEYNVALSFFYELENVLKERNKYINSIKFIFTPGNHDCYLRDDNPVRDALLSTIKNENIQTPIIDQCITVQDNYWAFFSQITKNTEVKSKISYQVKDMLTTESNIIFNCYNSSWMSVKNEKDNNKIMPSSALLSTDRKINDIVISVFHHPTSWFSPHTDNNNKKQFEEHLLKTSNIVLCGHEHSNTTRKMASLNSSAEFIYLEGSAFQNKNQSGFNFITIDSNDFSGNCISYEISTNDYVEKNSNTFKLNHSRADVNISEDFYNTINNISIPIKHSSVEHLTLSDIFIFPDLEPMKEGREMSSRRNVDSYDILNYDDNLVIIEGESQSGRTSLLYAYYNHLHKKEYYPVYFKGSAIKGFNIKDLLKTPIKSQYRQPFTYAEYFKKDISKRICLIDDINKCNLNSAGKSRLVEELKKHFNKVIITTQEANEIHTLTENHKIYNDFIHYRISPLGHFKRNALIERWIKLSHTNEYQINEDEVATNIKKTYDTISSLLGEQLIPSYPIFILSLLQSLDSQLKFDVAPTSYAYCYHSLIHLSLMREGVTNNEMGSLFNFLTEFAHLLYNKKISGMHIDHFSLFYDNYKNKYPFDFSCDKIVSILTRSNILKLDDDCIMFSYKYLSYYLSAKKISSFIHEKRGEEEIKRLCNNIHTESNANVLIFLTHHTSDNNLIEELLFASMLPFESREPITLAINDPFFSFLQTFVSAIKDDVILNNNNPEEYRKKQLQEADKKDTNSSKPNQLTEDDFKDPNIVDITQTLKIIKILGQIVKNQHGNFEKERLSSLIKSSYLAAFRLINFFSTMLIDAKGELVDALTKDISDPSNRDLVQRKVSDFLYFLGYRMCLMTFSNLSNAVGTSTLKTLYDDVANDINTPAAKLITFTIKTYYGSMNTSELEQLMNEFKDNQVAQRIIKARVLNHVYNNNVPFDKKQKISSICQIKLLN